MRSMKTGTEAETYLEIKGCMCIYWNALNVFILLVLACIKLYSLSPAHTKAHTVGFPPSECSISIFILLILLTGLMQNPSQWERRSNMAKGKKQKAKSKKCAYTPHIFVYYRIDVTLNRRPFLQDLRMQSL